MTQLSIENVTNQSATGTFDVLAGSVLSKLQQEFDASRLKGTEYSTVYAAALESLLAQSLQFVLTRDINAAQALLIQAQVELAQAQRDGVLKDIELTSAQITKINAEIELLGIQQSLIAAQEQIAVVEKLRVIADTERINKEVEVLDVQKTKLNNEVLQIQAQTTHVTAQTGMVTAQALNVPKEGILLDKQAAMLTAQVLNVPKEGQVLDKQAELITAQKTKVVSDSLHVDAQTTHVNKQVEVLTAQLVNIPKEGQLLDMQVGKTDKETVFLSQRIVTEKAQVLDVVDGVTVTGVLGKQKLLYAAQIDGFTYDTKHKLLTTMVNTWLTRRTTDTGTPASALANITDADIGKVVATCMASVGVTPSTPIT